MSSIRLADRLREIEGSPTLALAATAKALAKAGKRVADFTAGEPDFPTPDHAKAAGRAAIDENQTYYTPVAGIPELREAVAKAAGNFLLGSKSKSEFKNRVDKILRRFGEQIKFLHLHENDFKSDKHKTDIGKVIDQKLFMRLTNGREYIFEEGE